MRKFTVFKTSDRTYIDTYTHLSLYIYILKTEVRTEVPTQCIYVFRTVLTITATVSPNSINRLGSVAET
jgi:hypothetical protein